MLNEFCHYFLFCAGVLLQKERKSSQLFKKLFDSPKRSIESVLFHIVSQKNVLDIYPFISDDKWFIFRFNEPIIKMREFCWEIMKYHPFAREKEIEIQWTYNKCISFLLTKHFLVHRPKNQTGLSGTRYLYVDPFSWIEIEFESIPKEGVFEVLFYNLIFY